MGGEAGEARPIEAYGLIGDCRTSALVSDHGSVDWFCLPRFDGPSVFGAILDRDRGGRFRVAPTGSWTSRRRYVGPTAVLETTFTTEDGELVLTDLLTVRGPEASRARATPLHELLRRVACTRGQVEVDVLFEPRPDYGRRAGRLEPHGALGIWCQHRGNALALVSDVPLVLDAERRTARARIQLRAGDTRWLSLTCARAEPLVLLPVGAAAESRLTETLSWWEAWAARVRYQGEHAEAVTRSAITLKLLTYAPSGAVVAAPTTSLPEVPRGSRNWDYRFCWLRDASWILRALLELGFEEEADAFFGWILYTTRLKGPPLQTVYDIHGHDHLDETEIDLAGYGGARPVRVGNAAASQLQLDVYGEVAATAFEYAKRGGTFDKADHGFLIRLGKAVCEKWREPDEGIWEVRGGPRHHTYSKVMCWAALDRLVKMTEEGWLEDGPTEDFRATMEEIRAEVEAHGCDPERGYTGVFDRDLVDAALLRLPMSGYVDASDPRMVRTYERVVSELDCGKGLLYRYGPDFDELPGREGAFGLSSFWAIECKALAGEIEAAREHFDEMIAHANELGLYAEEIDPDTGRFLGNFPQAFTHLGLVNAAITLAAASRRDPEGEPRRERTGSEGQAPAGTSS